jgi:hypothetical protein
MYEININACKTDGRKLKLKKQQWIHKCDNGLINKLRAMSIINKSFTNTVILFKIINFNTSKYAN